MLMPTSCHSEVWRVEGNNPHLSTGTAHIPDVHINLYNYVGSTCVMLYLHGMHVWLARLHNQFCHDNGES